jgi:hypothetical protein
MLDRPRYMGESDVAGPLPPPREKRQSSEIPMTAGWPVFGAGTPPDLGVDLPSDSLYDPSASSTDLACGCCGKSGRSVAELKLTPGVYICRRCALRTFRRANKYGARFERSDGSH